MANAQILVVEDESIIAKNIEHELKSMGYEVPAIAASGEEAIRKAEETLPDLVLMDMVLRGEMDGVETTEHIQERLDIPVVYLTAYADDHTLQRAKTTEPYGYLVKPYEERELRTTIEVALYKHKLEGIAKEMQGWRAAILRSIGDAVIVTDAKGCIRISNRAAEILTGWQDEDAFGKDLTRVLHLIDERTRTVRGFPAAKALPRGSAVELEEHSLLIGRGGREVPIEGTIAPIYDSRQDFTGYVVTFRDITERKRAEKALREGEEELRQVQKMEAIGRMAGGMAHDFNQLLTVISSNISSVLSGTPQDDANRKYLLHAENAAQRGAEVVKQLVDFSRQRMLRPEAIDLNSAVTPMIETLRRILDPQITLEFKPSQGLWQVHADPTQMNEVLMNLCLNARDAMPNGGQIIIETENVLLGSESPRLRQGHQQGEFVCVRISDSGHGIPPAIRSRIFDPLFSTKEPGKGSGLGLSLVLGIIEQHRGWIDFSTEADEGTRIEVFLPRLSAEAVATHNGEGALRI